MFSNLLDKMFCLVALMYNTVISVDAIIGDDSYLHHDYQMYGDRNYEDPSSLDFELVGMFPQTEERVTNNEQVYISKKRLQTGRNILKY